MGILALRVLVVEIDSYPPMTAHMGTVAIVESDLPRGG
jgi:hypothetical protein